MSILVKESSEPVTSLQPLVEYFANAVKPKSGWLIGTEHEKFGFRLSTLKPATYDEPNGLRDLYNGFQQFGWKSIMEGQNIIGLTRAGAAISFEPGGQVELSGAPLKTLHENSAEIDQHLIEVAELADKLGIGFIGMGFHPTAKREDISWVPKERYKIMRAYMPKKGTRGLDMMLRTCTVQVNLDFSSEEDMVQKLRIGLALQPIATAIFATSPFVEGKPNGYLSNRMMCWLDTDNDRSGNLPAAFGEGFGFERYAEYALDVPMYFVWRDGKYIDASGQSFRDFMQGKLPALPGEYPTLTDWANHLTTLFPDVRVKKILEMRGADSGSPDLLKALPAFWVGLLYDDTARNAAWDLVKGWTAEQRNQMHKDAPRIGFATKIGNLSLLDIARQATIIARDGLKRRNIQAAGGVDESRYLDTISEIVEKGRSRADEMLAMAKISPEFRVESLFESERLRPPESPPGYIETRKT